MKPFLESGPYVAIDFETSARSGACACAVGMVRLENQQIVDRFYSLIRPGYRKICYTNVHGLTWEMLKSERSFKEVWPDMLAFIRGAKYLIAHNARFDRAVLNSNCDAYGIAPPRLGFLCTLAGARKALKLPGYGLEAVSAYFQIELEHHHAESDAAACGQIHCRLQQLKLADKAMLLPPVKSGPARASRGREE